MDFSNKSRNLQIGSYLQTLRLEQDLTLEQLSILSQVPVIHLTSIEEGRFSRFDEFYLKLYLKRFTGSLDVDLEQLYTYASQQPLPDLSESDDAEKHDERQMTKMQANISATPKNIIKTNPQRKNLKVANIANLENKKRVIKFITGLVFIILLALIVIFIVTLIRDVANRDPYEEETLPTIVSNPIEIIDDEGEEEIDEPDPEPEPEPDPETIIEFVNSVSTYQTFTVVTSYDEIEIRLEHIGSNWIGIFIEDNLVVSSTYHDTFRRTFDFEDEIRIELSVGALSHVAAIYINDVEVDFIFEPDTWQQNLIFYVESN